MMLTDDAKNAMLQGLADKLNEGANASLVIYADDDAVATFEMPNPIDDSITSGKLTFNLPKQVLATASATPTTAKLFNGNSIEVALLTIGTDMILDNSAVYKGGYVSITSLTIQI
ncbi:hypothetical protein [Psychrobacter pygoscelis]|uniref:hypothetical protein n=1 Tax=Psychrobacter pygoscelis TaxID=2488563 RepID=UPI00103E9704|nr:hypothetical protein [Psychrobacter pygoscelis]